MKLLFSESRADYTHYIFPYAIWAFPEPGETPGDLFDKGFLPSSRNLDRFYLCRQIRIDLRKFTASSENRRILRKGNGIESTLISRPEFEYSGLRREFCKTYADAKFGKDVMTFDRLDSLFGGKITSHILSFTEVQSGKEVGLVTLYLEPNSLAYYYHAFYDLDYSARNLGMFIMTSTVARFASAGFKFVYLGSCYVPNALYKFQFSGAEFFNGVRWSDNLQELKYLIGRDKEPQKHHLLENEEYRQNYYGCSSTELATTNGLGTRSNPYHPAQEES